MRDFPRNDSSYAIAAAAPCDGSGSVIRCTHDQVPGVGYMLNVAVLNLVGTMHTAVV
jgi:hypothetical protein